jgi:hypothetical protein
MPGMLARAIVSWEETVFFPFGGFSGVPLLGISSA